MKHLRCAQQAPAKPKVMGIVGHSGMGKTTLLERLIPTLSERGIKVALIKHSHKDIEVDQPGKDSYRLRQAGCNEVLLIGRHRWALMHELKHHEEPELPDFLSHLSPCDLVLIEGFKQHPFPKLEVYRHMGARAPLWPNTPGVVGVATDAPSLSALTGVSLAHFDLADVQPLADFVWANAVSVIDLVQR